MLRLGLRYVRGFRQTMAESVVANRNARRFASISDLTVRASQLTKPDLRMLATIGALNTIATDGGVKAHRRNALWQIEKYSSWLIE